MQTPRSVWAQLVLSIPVSQNANVKIHSQCLGRIMQALVLGQVSRIWNTMSGVTTRTLFVSPCCPSMTPSPCLGSVFQAVAVLTSFCLKVFPQHLTKPMTKFGYATGSVNVEIQRVKNTGTVTDPDIGVKWLRGTMRTYRSVIR